MKMSLYVASKEFIVFQIKIKNWFSVCSATSHTGANQNIV